MGLVASKTPQHNVTHSTLLSQLQREEVAGNWRRLRCEELHNMHSSSNIIRVEKSRRLRWAGHVARTVLYEKCIQYFGRKS
jgi:hypothetical protein